MIEEDEIDTYSKKSPLHFGSEVFSLLVKQEPAALESASYCRNGVGWQDNHAQSHRNAARTGGSLFTQCQ